MVDTTGAEVNMSISWNVITSFFEEMVPGVFMVLFMAKMSFTVWSELDAEEESSTVITFMDREVAGRWFDRVRPIQGYRFSNYEHNCPDRENSERDGSDSSSAIRSKVSSSQMTCDEEQQI